MRFLMVMILVGCASLLYSQDAANETLETMNDRRIGFGLQGGYFNPVDADGASFMGGVLAQAKFSEFFGAELSINYRCEKYADGLVSVKSWPLLISALYYPFDQVHGMIGLGIYSTTFDYPDYAIGGTTYSDETQTNVGFHVGGGVSFPIFTGFRLTTDLRYHILGYDLKEVAQVQDAKDVSANYLSILAGLLFEF